MAKERNPPSKSRLFHAILYPDCPSHVEALEYIKRSGWSFAYILHDKDTFDNISDENDTDEKKAHYHIIFGWSVASARSSSGVSKELKIEERFVKVASVKSENLCYLVHYNLPSKHQYSITEVYGTQDYIKILTDTIRNDDSKDESEELLAILDFVEDNSIRKLSEVLRFCAKEGYLNTYRKYQYTVISVLKER